MSSVLGWFAGHRVAANMMMWVILIGGTLSALSIEQEVFPDVGSDVVTVTVVHRGATPEEVEEGVCIRIEEAIQGVDGIRRITSRAMQGLGVVTAEVRRGEPVREVLDDVKTAVDAIDTFPEEIEQPVIQEFELVRQVLNVAVSGDVGEHVLRRIGERVRDEILALPGITRAHLVAVRPYEISIELREADMRRWGLTFDEVAAAVRRQSVDLSGGVIKAESGEIRLRTKERAYRGDAFDALVLRSRPDGTRLLLGDVADVIDGFEDTGQSARFDGRPGVLVRVFRVGDQRALEIADTVHRWVADNEDRWPEGILVTTWQDEARVLESRLDLLIRNGRVGLLLVFLTLALFLRLSLAFWVAVGIAVSFLGALWLMPVLGVSINLISLFGFIIALGLVVDDAIVVGENIYRHHEAGAEGMDAVGPGTGEVATPVVFAILTTVAAFSPLAGIPGVMGRFIAQLPLVVVPVLAFSMVESLLILPAHLTHLRRRTRRLPGPLGAWEVVQTRFSSLLQAVIEHAYRPTLAVVLRWRYAVLAAGIGVVVVTLTLPAAGIMRFVFFPDVEADNVLCWLTMPQGTPDDVTAGHARRLERQALALGETIEAELGEPVFRHVMTSVGEMPFRADTNRAFGNTSAATGGHLAEINIELVPSEDRSIGSEEILRRWREQAGEVPGAVELVFDSSVVPTGKPIDVQLSGPDVDQLRRLADELSDHLREYPGVRDVADSFRAGPTELRLDLTPEAVAAGFGTLDLARQVRQGYFGEEAQRIQRGREEVRVMVRYAEHERRSPAGLADMRLRHPDGRRMPVSDAVTIETTRGDAVIERADRRRALHVTADVDLSENDPNTILGDLREDVLPGLVASAPGTSWSLEGEQREQAETVGGLASGFALALVLIYALLAIPFRSYAQPAIVMLAIPFGLVGAIGGHLLLGMDLTIMSFFGMVALTGVLVNDSLVMVDFVNVRRRGGMSIRQAILEAGPERFRPILLTSLTTFAGLLPLLLERSLQARFLIPMAVSLAFGVLFATAITLVIVPVAYLILEDLAAFAARVRGALRPPAAPADPGLGARAD